MENSHPDNRKLSSHWLTILYRFQVPSVRILQRAWANYIKHGTRGLRDKKFLKREFKNLETQDDHDKQMRNQNRLVESALCTARDSATPANSEKAKGHLSGHRFTIHLYMEA